MRTYSANMLAHIAQVSTTLTRCLRIERLDGVVLAITAFNRALTIDTGHGSPTDVYEPFGINKMDLTAQNDMDVGTTECMLLQSDLLTDDDLLLGRWDFAAYELFEVNWADLSMGRILLQSGNLGVCRSGRLKFETELLGLMQHVQNSIGNLNSPLCIADLGDELCQVDLNGTSGSSPSEPLTVTGTIDAIDSDFYGIHDTARTEPANRFANGKMTLTDGPYVGMSFEVRAYISGFWVLFTAVPDGVTVGTGYSMSVGCDKSKRMCIDFFDNILHRRASDYTQGNDKAVQVGRHSDS